MDTKNVLEVKNLKTYFYTDEGVVKSVDGLDFNLGEGRTLAIVGESGCGKSVTSFSILRIIQSPPGKIVDGEILFCGKDLLKLPESEMRKIRGDEISMIFQEPMTSLNPVFTAGQQIVQTLLFHTDLTKQQAREKAVEMIRVVGIPDAGRIADQYPYQLSGGQRQRIMIAMALACQPKILIADEPTTALDVTIQAQILHLMVDMKKKFNTSMILITHDLGIVAQVADDVMVMYAGQAVECAPMRSLYKDPKHPYTSGLLKALPKMSEKVDRLHTISGAVPSAANFPDGCRFAARCEFCKEICKKKMPALYSLPDGRKVRCHLYAQGVRK